MIKIYSMSTCPTCSKIKEQAKGDDRFQVVNLEEHVRNLKEFLKLRDTNPAFDEAKRKGSVGIPCFLLEDGTVKFDPEEVGLCDNVPEEGQACSLDGKGC